METVFPDRPGFSGLYLVGYRRTPPSGPVQAVGCALVKRSYRIQGSTLEPDADGEGVRVEEEVQEETIGEDDEKISVVTRESDLAPYKPEADLVVLGFRGGDVEGRASVDGTVWLSRPAGSDDGDDSDTTRNLFGWAQRNREPGDSESRFEEAGADSYSDEADDYPQEWPVPATPPVPPLTGFENVFFNAYRRDFKVLDGDLPYFQPGQDVSIERDGADTVTVTLGPERLGGRVHYWCDRGPDRPTYWCEMELDDLVSDTLVVEPDEDRAYRVWRGVWPLERAGEPSAEQYRRLVVEAEED